MNLKKESKKYKESDISREIVDFEVVKSGKGSIVHNIGVKNDLELIFEVLLIL
jgi:hypothetical protein